VAVAEQNSNRLKTTFCVTGGVVGITYGPWGTGGVATATPGLYRAELKTTEGNGHIALGMFVKVEGGAPPPPTPAGAPPPPAEAPPPAPAAPAPTP